MILLRIYGIWDFDASIDAASEESKQNDTYQNMWIRCSDVLSSLPLLIEFATIFEYCMHGGMESIRSFFFDG